MQLQPIPQTKQNVSAPFDTHECLEILNVYESYYPKIGFELPWIGYFILDNNVVVGTCSFTGKPTDNRVEIAYYTFPAYEKKGYASWACKELVRIAKQTAPEVIVTAKTAPEENPSTAILRKNGFKQDGIVQDDEIGNAWYWILDVTMGSLSS